jgi:hypothetical protein
MIRKLALIFVASCAAQAPAPASPPPPAAASAPTQLDPAFAPLQKLVGTWQGNDPDHHTTGGFTLEPELGGKVLVRRSTNEGSAGRHADLMIVFATPAGLRASYWDNEGHVIDYAVNATGDRVELLSDDVPDRPRFKLTNELHGADELAIDFAVKMPGAPDFQHYVGGTVHRVR